MTTAEIVKSLLDEMPVIQEISKDLPTPYKKKFRKKLKNINRYLVEILTSEEKKINQEIH